MNMRLDELKSETVISIGMEISDLSSNKPYFSYNQPLTDIIKCPLLKSLEKYSHASQFTKNLSYTTLEGGTLLQIQKYGIPYFLPYYNIYQQTRAGQNTNISKEKIIASITSSSHQTHILNFTQKNKTMKHYQQH